MANIVVVDTKAEKLCLDFSYGRLHNSAVPTKKKNLDNVKGL